MCSRAVKIVAVAIIIAAAANAWLIVCAVGHVRAGQAALDHRLETLEVMHADMLDQIMDLRRDIAPAAEAAYCPITPAEREQVARIICAEAGTADERGMTAVAQTIRDRAMAWDMSVTDVTTAPGQYVSAYAGRIPPEVYAVIDDVFVWGASALEVPTTHFCAEGTSPYWTGGKVSRGIAGGNRFWY